MTLPTISESTLDTINRSESHIFGLADYERWLDEIARSVLGIPGEQFMAEWRDGEHRLLPSAQDLAVVIPVIEALRLRLRRT